MKRRQINIIKVEQKTVNELVNVEAAYRRHKAFSKAHGKEPQSKEVFIADYLKHQEPKITAIKSIIAKFNDKKAPIMNSQCLEFRRLFSLRQGYIDTKKFASELTSKEWQIFYNHANRCDSCTFYAVLHKFDAPIIPEFREASQAEFEQGLDEFFSTFKKQGDPIEEWERKHNFKPIDPKEVSQAIAKEYS
jgi:hypothetical protein